MLTRAVCIGRNKIRCINGTALPIKHNYPIGTIVVVETIANNVTKMIMEENNGYGYSN